MEKIEKLNIEIERSQFKRLLLEKPDYFAKSKINAKATASAASLSTKYEELTCVGHNINLSTLEATLQIKQSSGYKSGLCQAGSFEFVRFFINYGGGWQDLGLSNVNVHDIPTEKNCAKQPEKPLSYVVSLPFEPQRKFCENPVLPKVRAILSWEVEPPAGNPNYIPFWGNVHECNIQIKPKPHPLIVTTPVKPFLDLDFKPELPGLINPPDPAPLGIGELVKLYTKDEKRKTFSVEPHRFALGEIATLQSASSFSQAQITKTSLEFKNLGLDWADILKVIDKTKADVTYEELECLGLDYNREWLVGTLRVKKPSGYSGTLCQPGSKEYVAFWADFNDTCEWTYLGTVEVVVHDFPQFPAEGICYSAVLPVDLNQFRQGCHKPKVGRVRAVLSWNVPPSTTDPDDLNHWGNRIDTHVQIKPGPSVPVGTPNISILGGIGIDQINYTTTGLTKPNAVFAYNGAGTDWRPCPFGGIIVVNGMPSVGYKYRVWVRKFGTVNEINVTDPIWTVNWLGVGTLRNPDASGFFDYLSQLDNMLNTLAQWHSTGDDLWELRLEIADGLGVPLGSTIWHRLQLDNTPPLDPSTSSPENVSIHIDSGGDCKDFTVGIVVNGHFVARDEYFGSFSLSTLPFPAPAGQLTASIPSTSQTPLAPGATWQLNTAGMAPCGYVVVLNVRDRAIVNSVTVGHHSQASVGFCLRGEH